MLIFTDSSSEFIWQYGTKVKGKTLNMTKRFGPGAHYGKDWNGKGKNLWEILVLCNLRGCGLM